MSEMTLQSRLQTQPLASLIGFTAGQPVSVLAGAAITLANRTDLNALSDIAHQRVCLSSLSCWQHKNPMQAAKACSSCKARTAATYITSVWPGLGLTTAYHSLASSLVTVYMHEPLMQCPLHIKVQCMSGINCSLQYRTPHAYDADASERFSACGNGKFHAS